MGFRIRVFADAQSLHSIISSLQSQLVREDIQHVIQEDVVMLKMLANLEHPLDSCLKTLDLLILKLQSHLKHRDEGEDIRFSNVDLKWWFIKGTFKDLMDRLGQNKGTLNIALTAITTLSVSYYISHSSRGVRAEKTF